MSLVPCPMYLSNDPMPLGLQQADRFTALVARNAQGRVLPDVSPYQFAQHGTEVGGHLEVPFLKKLFRFQTGPPAIDPSAANRPSQQEHHVAVAVVGTVVAIFGSGSAKLRHRDDDDVFHAVSHIARERRKRITELLEKLRQLRIL